MKLICNGYSLDLKKDTAFTFQKTNPLFAFSELECERTQSFSLPDTVTNNEAFGLEKIPTFHGTGMRKKFSAQYQDGVVTKDGYLYVQSYEGGEYKAVFITGELFGMKKIQEAGKIKEILSHITDSVVWSSGNEQDATTSAFFGMYRYMRVNSATPMLPSLNVRQLIERCQSSVGFAIKSLPTTAETARIVVSEPSGVKEQSITLTSTPVSESERGQLNECSTASSSNEAVLEPGAIFYAQPVMEVKKDEEGLYLERCSRGDVFRLSGWRVPPGTGGMLIKFPIDFPDDFVMVTEVLYDTSRYWQAATCLGGYEFEKVRSFQSIWGGTTHGTPLAGRTVTVPEGTVFGFVNVKHFTVDIEGIIGEEGEMVSNCVLFRADPHEVSTDYSDIGQPAYEFTVEVEQVGEVESGSVLFASANIPDISLVELMQTYAATCGCLLNYNDSDGVVFDTLSDWEKVVDLTGSVIKRGVVKKTFADYAQHNYIKHDTSETVKTIEKIARDYTVDNDMLDDGRDLFEIPFSEAGTAYDSNGNELAYLRNSEDEDGFTDKPVLMQTNTDGVIYMRRVGIPKIGGLQNACDRHIYIEVSAQMELFEFEAVTSKTLLYLDGVKYIWTSGTWSKGVAKWKMSAIGS